MEFRRCNPRYIQWLGDSWEAALKFALWRAKYTHEKQTIYKYDDKRWAVGPYGGPYGP